MSEPLASLLACLCLQSELDRAREALAAGDYGEAWNIVQAAPDEIERYRGRAEILYRAGDPAGALAAARAGLVLAPEQIDLLFHAAGAAIWMQDVLLAEEFTRRFLRAVDSLGVQLPEKNAWEEIARDFSARARAVAVRDKDLERALTRLEVLSLGGLGSLIVLASAAALRGQGKSSNPVS